VTIRASLEKDARAFLTRAPLAFSNDSYSVLEAALQRLIDWSVAHAPDVQWAPSDGSDAKVGVSAGPARLMVWRVFPRKDDGGKVTLMPGSGRDIADAVHRETVNVLNTLRPDDPIKPGSALEVDLHAIAPDAQWHMFEPALQLALDTSRGSS